MAVPHSGVPLPAVPPADATLDDVVASTVTVGTLTATSATITTLTAPHSGLTGVTANQHHAQAHVITGADHTASGLTGGHVMRATGGTTFAFGALQDSDVPSTIARDSEVTTAVSDHAALADPHTGYRLESADHSHASAGLQGGTVAHSALTGLTSGDPHTQYQQESEKAAASGYASLDSTTRLPIAQAPAAMGLGVLGYAEVTANQGTITTEADLTSLSVAVTVGTSRRIRISTNAKFFSSVANDIARVSVKEDTTLLNLNQVVCVSTSQSLGAPVEHVFTPSSGSKTYKLTAQRATGTGNITMAAAATNPVHILVEDIGAA